MSGKFRKTTKNRRKLSCELNISNIQILADIIFAIRCYGGSAT